VRFRLHSPPFEAGGKPFFEGVTVGPGLALALSRPKRVGPTLASGLQHLLPGQVAAETAAPQCSPVRESNPGNGISIKGSLVPLFRSSIATRSLPQISLNVKTFISRLHYGQSDFAPASVD
jgi:hypothetical protein